MDAEAKLVAIQEQQQYLQNNLAPIAQIYGYNMTWDTSAIDAQVAEAKAATATATAKANAEAQAASELSAQEAAAASTAQGYNVG